MQVCTSVQTDNHASTPPLSFLQAGCHSCHPTNSVKDLRCNIRWLYSVLVQWEILPSETEPDVRFNSTDVYLVDYSTLTALNNRVSNFYPVHFLFIVIVTAEHLWTDIDVASYWTAMLIQLTVTSIGNHIQTLQQTCIHNLSTCFSFQPPKINNFHPCICIM